MMWYPIRFAPIYKQKIWGGSNLNTLKNISDPIDRLGESWEVSSVGNDISIVDNGPLMGRSLLELIKEYPIEVMGQNVYKKFGYRFPLLIKYIDAAQDLSIQLHPDNAVALEKHNSFGKTEMWYIMNATPDAKLTLGFKEDCNEHAFAKAVQDKTITNLLNIQKVVAGESYYIRPGFIHAIGSGVTLAEIQQSSDLTYRVYDYDRKDRDGKVRDLHINDAMEAVDYKKADDFKLNYREEVGKRQNLKKTNYFETDILLFNDRKKLELKTGLSFTIVMNVGDECVIDHADRSYTFRNSQTYFIPAAIQSLEVFTNGKGKLLIIHL